MPLAGGELAGLGHGRPVITGEGLRAVYAEDDLFALVGELGDVGIGFGRIDLSQLKPKQVDPPRLRRRLSVTMYTRDALNE